VPLFHPRRLLLALASSRCHLDLAGEPMKPPPQYAPSVALLPFATHCRALRQGDEAVDFSLLFSFALYLTHTTAELSQGVTVRRHETCVISVLVKCQGEFAVVRLRPHAYTSLPANSDEVLAAVHEGPPRLVPVLARIPFRSTVNL
jgi:hypothetical protein